jgi:hypothetical protein
VSKWVAAATAGALHVDPRSPVPENQVGARGIANGLPVTEPPLFADKAIRAWAKKEGKDISDRGRIPQEIVDDYHTKAGR